MDNKTNSNLYKMCDSNGNTIILINDIIFKGKRNINWSDVEDYVKRYIGEIYEIVETKDIIYISKDFPDEFTGSRDTRNLRGAVAKAKANIAQVIPQLIKYATNKRFKENKNEKHKVDAKYGWYRYHARVGIPVFLDNDDIDRYNIFHMEILIRHAEDDNLYLYDIVNIKKETSNPPKQ